MESKFTAKQIAELLEVSKPTVQKTINKAEIQPVEIRKNKFRFYSYEDTVSIVKKIKPSFNLDLLQELSEKPKNKTEKPQENTEKPQKSFEKPQNKTAKPQSSEELELLRKTVEIIERQLEEKDKQIKELSDRLSEALQLTKGQQYITAADKTTELLEADNKRTQTINEDVIEPAASSTEKGEEKQTKKSFWQRLFGL